MNVCDGELRIAAGTVRTAFGISVRARLRPEVEGDVGRTWIGGSGSGWRTRRPSSTPTADDSCRATPARLAWSSNSVRTSSRRASDSSSARGGRFLPSGLGVSLSDCPASARVIPPKAGDLPIFRHRKVSKRRRLPGPRPAISIASRLADTICIVAIPSCAIRLVFICATPATRGRNRGGPASQWRWLRAGKSIGDG